VNLVFFGTSPFGIPSLEAIAKSRHTLKAVVSTPNKPRGRSLKVQASAVKQWAADHGCAYLDFFKEHPSQTLSALKELNADVFVVISFGVILKKEVLALPRLIPVNVHASLLPKYRGASPMQAALLNGDSRTGVTVMRMIEKLDAGEIILKNSFSLDGREDIQSLEKRLADLAAASLIEALDLIEKGRPPLKPQDEKEVSYAPKIVKEDGRIRWNENAGGLGAKIRAYRGWPGSYFFFQGKRILVCAAEPLLAYAAGVPGTVLKASAQDGLVVASGEKTALKLEELQLEGRKAMGWKEFLRGFPLKAGDLLE
jgi:methionyl-tRNA formyltransferase